MTIELEARKADVDSVQALIQGRYRIGESFTQNELRPEITGAGMQVTPHGIGAIYQHLKRRGVIRKWHGEEVLSTNGPSRGDTVDTWIRIS